MEFIWEQIEKMNVGNIIAIGSMLWFFYSRLDRKIEKIDIRLSDKIDKTNERIDKAGERIDRLAERISSLDNRISRLEGAFSAKDCCMIKDSNQMRKAE